MWQIPDKASKPLGIDFLRFFFSRILSRVSQMMFYIYYMWILIVKYDSVFLVSLIPTLSLAGYLIVLLPEGYMLDRFPREAMMFFSSLALFLTYALLFVSQSLEYIYIAALLSSIFSSIVGDAFFTLTKNIVEEHAIGKAMSVLQIGVSVSELIGVLLGGVSTVFISRLFIVFLSLMAFLSFLLSFPTGLKRVTKTQVNYGFTHVFRAIRKMLSFLSTILLINGLFISIDVYASGLFYKVLHTGPIYYTLFIMSFSLGGLTGGILGVKISKKLSNPAFIGLSVATLGFLFAFISVNRIPYIDPIVTLFLGLIVSLVNIPLNSYLIRLVPNEILGRVNSVITIFSASSSPIMAVVYGLLASFLPITIALGIVSIILLISSIPTFLTVRKIFKLSENDFREILRDSQ